jgi:hypothetical protein
VFGTSWALPCDVAGRNVSGFYMGWRLLPWLGCCVSEFRPAHRPHEPAQPPGFRDRPRRPATLTAHPRR